MKICVMDAHTVPTEHPAWNQLATLGQVQTFQSTPHTPEVIIERCQQAQVVLTNKVPFDAHTIERLSSLRYIGVLATGVDHIATDIAQSKGIVVANVAGYATQMVAQHAFALLLALCSRVVSHHNDIKKGLWSEKGTFYYLQAPPFELAGKTFGVVGLGAIGQAACKIATAFGMRIMAHVRTRPSVQALSDMQLPHLEFAQNLHHLCQQSDVVSLHCPSTALTRQLMDAEALSQMRPTAYLINTARGALVDEQALAQALANDRIAGAGLDVFADEPLPKQSPLMKLDNCIMSGHMAWCSPEACGRLFKNAVDALEDYAKKRQTPDIFAHNAAFPTVLKSV